MGRKPVNKKRNNNFEKKDLYLNQLASVFKEHGISKYNMDTIAKELGVSKATLYHYFKSKDEMLELITINILQKISDAEKILKDKSLKYIDRYYHAIDLISQNISDISTVLLEDIRNYYPRIWKDIQAVIDYLSELLENYYNEGKTNKLFNDIDTKVLVLTDRLFFDAISDVDYLKKNKMSLQLLFDNYFKLKAFGFIKQHQSL
ncbi:MAG: TetR/AcrR family transcriptional regulator [Chitinophagales bacterium]|nr:TetR/AcrR family transcriptional regulator [Chitinophagales bacterium]